jgi:rare lipoprotein A
MDLSYAAAKKLGYANKGTTLVRVTAIDPYLWAKNKTAQPLVPQPAGLPDTFYVQVGAFSNPQNADSYRYRIAQLTRATVRVKYTSRINGTPLYRVQVGPLNAAQSNQLREALEQHALAPAMRVTT